MMKRQRIRSSLGLAVCIAAMYLFYSWVGVPFFLPNGGNGSLTTSGIHGGVGVDAESPLGQLFPEDAWELSSAGKRLTIGDDIIIMFQERTVEDGNRLRVTPCTLVFLGDKNLPESERYKQSILMRTKEFAELRFLTQVNLVTMSLSLDTFESGEIVGDVTITKAKSAPDVEDDLEVRTSNIEFNQTQLKTKYPIAFRFGKSRGAGENLLVVLEKQNPNLKRSGTGNVPPRDPSATDFTIRSIELSSLKFLDAVLPPKEPNSTDSERIAVRCTGRVDFVPDPDIGNQWVGRFRENVDVIRTETSGATSQLLADDLNLIFETQNESTNQTTSATETASIPNPNTPVQNTHSIGDLSKLVLRSVTAFGDPVQIRSPQHSGFVAKGKVLLYDALANDIFLDSVTSDSLDTPVVRAVSISFLDGNSEIKGKAIRYAPGQNGEFGSLEVRGSGSLLHREVPKPAVSGTPGMINSATTNTGMKTTVVTNTGMINSGMISPGATNSSSPTLTARWGDTLRIVPDEEDPTQLQISMRNGIHLQWGELGSMVADKIDIWCDRNTGSSKVGSTDGTNVSNVSMTTLVTLTPNTATTSPPRGGLAGLDSGSIQPQRAYIRDNVVFKSAEGTCNVRELKIWFYDGTEPVQSATRPSSGIPNRTPSAMPRTGPFAVTPSVIPTTKIPNTIAGSAGGIRPVAGEVSMPRTPSGVIPPYSTTKNPATGITDRNSGSVIPPYSSQPTGQRYSSNVPVPAAPRTPLQPDSRGVITGNTGNTRTEPKRSLLGGTRTAGDSTYRIDGDVMCTRVLAANGSHQIDYIILTGNKVTLNELQGANSRTEPLQVVGNAVYIAEPSSARTQIEIKGEPATFKGDGHEFYGTHVVISREKNFMQSFGRGKLYLKVAGNTDMFSLNSTQNSTKSPSEETVTVEWGGGMTFDGRQIRFDKQVRALYQVQMLCCDTLSLFLKESIPLFDSSSVRAEPEWLDAVGNVMIENQQFDATGVTAFNRAEELQQLRLNVQNGNFQIVGAGILRSTFRGAMKLGTSDVFSSRGSTGNNNGSGAGGNGVTSSTATSSNPTNSELTFAEVKFFQGLEGNYKLKDCLASGSVRCIAVPVDRIDATVNGNDDRRILDGKGAILKCEQLAVAQIPMPEMTLSQQGSRDGVEITATGSTKIYHDMYTIISEKAKYNEAKDLILVEGDGVIEAELYRQESPGTAATPLRAHRIEYRPKADQILTTGARSGNFKFGP